MIYVITVKNSNSNRSATPITESHWEKATKTKNRREKKVLNSRDSKSSNICPFHKKERREKEFAGKCKNHCTASRTQSAVNRSSLRAEMESDSDSDGSHISATPPREPKSRVPTPPPPPPPPRGPSILPSRTFRVRVDISSQTKSSSKPKQSVKLTKPSPETELNPSKQDRSTNPFPLPTPINLLNGPLLQNCRLSDQSRLVSVSKSIESLPAGYFSKLASFSKLQKPFLNLESVEQDSQKPGTEISQIDRLQGGSTQQGAGSEAGKIENSVKVINRHPNLIGGSIHPLPAKRPKCVGGAGNFVKLNINGHGRRFANKGRGNNRYTSSGRRYFKRSKRKLNAKSEAETDGLCDEDGLISEAPPLQQLKDCKALKFDCESIEEAALACRNDPSEENLMKLLKLAYGYDSFRDGQLEGIKMVLSGKSAMLVLPTGAGKSLCYQLAAMILPGLTLVISPLVALMIDQLKQLPPTIRGGMLSSIQVIVIPSLSFFYIHIFLFYFILLFSRPSRWLHLICYILDN